MVKNPQATKMRALGPNRVRPSSGYYGNAFSSRRDSDNESGCVSIKLVEKFCCNL